MSTKVALITGASSGIGEATAHKLQELGYTVYGAARRLDRMKALEEAGMHALAMDVTDESSVAATVEQIIAETGRIDVLVNNAGYGSYGTIEDTPLDEAHRQFEVNIFGAMNLTQKVLPHMRAQRSGTIVNISSMGGKMYSPLGGWYHGTKFALEGISDCLRMEVEPFGIKVVIIEPGGIATEWGGIAADNLEKVSGAGAYADQARAVAKSLRGGGINKGSKPTVISDAIAQALTAEKPKTRYAAGFGARPLIAAHAILPDRAFDRLMSMAMGMKRPKK